MSWSKILVVEDEAIVALDIKERLSHIGYKVTAAVPSGELALASVSEDKPDLVLMDIQIQGRLDGIETAERIRKTCDVPVVFLTANSDKTTLERARLTGPFGYLLKPFEERELHSTIQMALYRHKLERQVRESEEWLETTLRSIGDAVVAADAQGRLKYINPEAEKLTGWKLEDAAGEPIEKVLDLRSRRTGKPIENPIASVLRRQATVRLKDSIELVSRDGAVVPIDDSATPILTGNQVLVGAVMVFRDISKRLAAEAKLCRYQEQLEELVAERTSDLQRALEELRRETKVRKQTQERLAQAEKTQAIGLLAGGVAHDLNNILGPLVGYPTLILERIPADDEIAPMIKSIERSARMASGVIQDLLTLARSGNYQLAPLNLSHLVTEFLQSAAFERLTSERPGIRVEVNLGDDTVGIDGSSTHLFKVVMNLIVNAFEAMKTDGTLTIDTRRECLESDKSGHERIPSGDYLILSVSDSGVGIDPKDISKIFEPYFSKKKPRQSGTGLGLAVVNGIVKDHRGYCDVVSEPGQGTRFTLYFPVSGKHAATPAR